MAILEEYAEVKIAFFLLVRAHRGSNTDTAGSDQIESPQTWLNVGKARIKVILEN